MKWSFLHVSLVIFASINLLQLCGCRPQMQAGSLGQQRNNLNGRSQQITNFERRPVQGVESVITPVQTENQIVRPIQNGVITPGEVAAANNLGLVNQALAVKNRQERLQLAENIQNNRVQGKRRLTKDFIIGSNGQPVYNTGLNGRNTQGNSLNPARGDFNVGPFQHQPQIGISQLLQPLNQQQFSSGGQNIGGGGIPFGLQGLTSTFQGLSSAFPGMSILMAPIGALSGGQSGALPFTLIGK